jgi:hypothetical protein
VRDVADEDNVEVLDKESGYVAAKAGENNGFMEDGSQSMFVGKHMML